MIDRFKRWWRGELPEPRPRPPDWNKTLDDLAMENRSLSGEELEWARDYEREQLRAWVRFPKDGDVFEALGDIETTVMIYWRAPYGSSAEGVLPAGTRVRVSVNSGDAEPVGILALPLDEKAMEEHLVPELDRLSSKYAGYSIYLSVAQLNREFGLIP